MNAWSVVWVANTNKMFNLNVYLNILNYAVLGSLFKFFVAFKENRLNFLAFLAFSIFQLISFSFSSFGIF